MVSVFDAELLLTDDRWTGAEVTFAFPDSSSDYETNYSTEDEPTTGFLALSDGFRDIVREAFAEYDRVTAISFRETSIANADILLGQSAAVPVAWAYFPFPFSQSGGDIWFNPTQAGFAELRAGDDVIGSYGWTTILHEMGHALGLKHSHEAPKVSLAFDALPYTLMSYRGYVGDPEIGTYWNERNSYPQTLMMLDIAAIQMAYGANYETEAGDTTYHVDPATAVWSINGAEAAAPTGNIVFRTLWDGGGADLIDLSDYDTDLSVDLRPGRGIDLDVGGNAQRAHLDQREPDAYAPYHISMSLLHEYDPRSLIENVTAGSGDDLLRGNEADNRLKGGLGADIYTGYGGADQIAGTVSELNGDRATDLSFRDSILVENAAGAIPTMNVTEDRLSVGGATITVDGMVAGDTWLYTDTGDDIRLQYGGDDFVVLGASDETYVVAGERPVNVWAGAGADSIRALDGSGHLWGGPGTDSLFGSPFEDLLIAGAGNDVLEGNGGADRFVISVTDGQDSDFSVDTIVDYRPGEDTIVLVGFEFDGGVPPLGMLDGSLMAILGGGAYLHVLGMTLDDAVSFEMEPDIAAYSVLGAGNLRRLSDEDERFTSAGSEIGVEIEAKGGNDFVLGSSLDDILYGGPGSDVIYGSPGNDRIVPGQGNDVLRGGSGQDRFVINFGEETSSFSADTIEDFDLEDDVLEFAGFAPDARDAVTYFAGEGGTFIQIKTNRYVFLENIDPDNIAVDQVFDFV